MSNGEGGLRAPVRDIVAWQDEDYWNKDKLDEETRRQFDVCHGCRRCFNLCDSFPKLFDLIDESETYELDSVKSEDFKPIVDACTMCDMCFMVTCPYVPPHEFAIDIPKLMLRHRAKEFSEGKVGFKEKQISKIDRNGKLGQKTRVVSNSIVSLNNKPARYVMEKALNISKEAKLPKFAKPFKENFPINTKAPSFGKKAILFSTCYGSYHNTEIISSAYKVLRHNGVDVSLFYDGCCGMPQLEQGNIDRVMDQAKNISSKLVPLLSEEIPVIAPIPSCALMFKTEWPLLLPENNNVLTLSKNTMDIDEYMVQISENEGLADGLVALEGDITVHMACHSRAQNIGPKSAQMLRLIPNTKVNIIERCSGHGGSWGVKKENFDTALKVGKNSAKSIMKYDTKYFASTCPLAGDHLVQISEKEKNKDLKELTEPSHPIELIALAYNFNNE
jgi:glycerol-3-phosphate dehydrogenase subunit C